MALAVQAFKEAAVEDDPDQFMAQVLPFITQAKSGPEHTAETDDVSDFIKQVRQVRVKWADDDKISAHIDDVLELLGQNEPRRADYSLLLAYEAAGSNPVRGQIYKLRNLIVQEYRDDFRQYIPTMTYPRRRSLF